MRLPYPVILASASPRRRELFAELVPEFSIVVADVDEEALTSADPWRTAEDLAQAKASAVSARHPEAVVIGGDTVVAVQQDGLWVQLAKPRDEEDAVRMLRTLSGREHVVVTGVSLVWPTGGQTFSETTRVRFRDLSEEEIRRYVRTGEPMDKAGGYAIQGGAANFVIACDGSRSNVIGLPMEALERELAHCSDDVRQG